MRDTKRLENLTVNRRRRVPGPDLEPSSKRVERRVFLEPELFEELSECAKFQESVFSAMGVEEAVSRNSIIEVFLRWSVDAFWEERGGRPSSKSDFEAKVRKQAEKKMKAHK